MNPKVPVMVSGGAYIALSLLTPYVSEEMAHHSSVYINAIMAAPGLMPAPDDGPEHDSPTWPPMPRRVVSSTSATATVAFGISSRPFLNGLG